MIKICWIWTALVCLGNGSINGLKEVPLIEADNKIIYHKLHCPENKIKFTIEDNDTLKVCKKDIDVKITFKNLSK